MPILKQHKKSRNVILSLYILFIIILGISYAYYSETLSVTGVASIDGYVWPENILPALPEQTENGVNFNESFKSEYIEGNAISNQNRFENINESYDVATSTYKLNITKTYVIGQLVSPKRENFNLNFKIKNLSNLTWENGNTTYEIDSWSNLIDNVNISIDKTGKANGRGAYICNNKDCLEKVIKTKRLERVLETSISEEIYNELRGVISDK